MDKAKMIAAIVERHGVRLDKDDPALILVDLNVMALEEAAQKIAEHFDKAGEQVSEAASKMNLQTAQLVAAGDRFEKLLVMLSEESKRSIARAAEAAKKDQLQDLQQVMAAAAARAVGAAVNDRIEAAIESIRKATGTLESKSKTVTSAGKAITGAAWLYVSLSLIAAIVGSSLTIGALWYTGNLKAPATAAVQVTEQPVAAMQRRR